MCLWWGEKKNTKSLQNHNCFHSFTACVLSSKSRGSEEENGNENFLAILRQNEGKRWAKDLFTVQPTYVHIHTSLKTTKQQLEQKSYFSSLLSKHIHSTKLSLISFNWICHKSDGMWCDLSEKGVLWEYFEGEI